MNNKEYTNPIAVAQLVYYTAIALEYSKSAKLLIIFLNNSV